MAWGKSLFLSEGRRRRVRAVGGAHRPRNGAPRHGTPGRGFRPGAARERRTGRLETLSSGTVPSAIAPLGCERAGRPPAGAWRPSRPAGPGYPPNMGSGGRQGHAGGSPTANLCQPQRLATGSRSGAQQIGANQGFFAAAAAVTAAGRPSGLTIIKVNGDYSLLLNSIFPK